MISIRLLVAFLAVPSMVFVAVRSSNAGSIEVIDPATSAGYRVSSYVAETVIKPQINVIGVYETVSSSRFGVRVQGVARVRVEYDQEQPMLPMVLVLSSYEPTRWVMDVDERAEVAQIILNGYHPHVIDSAGDISVVNRSGFGTNRIAACAYKWPEDDQGCATPTLVRGLENSIGVPISEFAGVYRATEFVVQGSQMPESFLGCDFNADGACDLEDLDRRTLYGVDLVEGSEDPIDVVIYDLTGDDRVDAKDLDAWLVEAASHNGLSSPYLAGDTNLDGRVDFDDFQRLLEKYRFGRRFRHWSDGDFTGDRTVSFDDFVLLSANYGKSVNVATAVPEPSGGYLPVLCALGLLYFRRRRH